MSVYGTVASLVLSRFGHESFYSHSSSSAGSVRAVYLIDKAQ